MVKAWTSAIESSEQLFLGFRSGSGSERAAIGSGSGSEQGTQLHLVWPASSVSGCFSGAQTRCSALESVAEPLPLPTATFGTAASTASTASAP